MKHVLLNTALTLIALTATISAAADPPRDISAEIATLRPEIVSAKVYHLFDSLHFRTARDEAFTASGCYYDARDDDLTALLNALTAGGLHETQRQPDEFFEVRTIVYLARRDGSTVPLLLSTRAPGMQSYGSYARTVPITADGAFSTALHEWMTPRTPIDPDTSEPCINQLHIQ